MAEKLYYPRPYQRMIVLVALKPKLQDVMLSGANQIVLMKDLGPIYWLESGLCHLKINIFDD